MDRCGLLCARDITKAYGSRTVLRVAELSLGKGAALCLFGPNGSGKSTLLDILALAAKPDGGTFVIGGTDALSDPRAVRGTIGYAPQDIALFDELTVFENLLCWSRDSGAAAKADVERVMEEMMLSALRKKRVRELSGGMKRRVNLAVALLGSPSLLVLDEPFAGMDFEVIDNTLSLLAAQKAKGVALLLSDHSASRPLPLLDKVMVLREGIAVFNGSRGDFLALSSGADDALRLILAGDRV
ncbi:MAG: ABC transporter ATP-binding protein [Clostridia bacterium]|nr:ABC transporter ATP-binding protein [Clostridia bacterium]NCC69230.1 ABC transporter ATP-binding protein [Clostridia bacterium]